MKRRWTIARCGVSMLEVIACTALVSLMMLPMAGVIRASGQMIRENDGFASRSPSPPDIGLALQRYMRNCDAIVKHSEDVLVVMHQGAVVEIVVADTTLVARGPKEPVVIAEGISSIRYEKAFVTDTGEIHAVMATLDVVDSKNGIRAEPWTMALAVDR
jgi:hypothetical protein